MITNRSVIKETCVHKFVIEIHRTIFSIFNEQLSLSLSLPPVLLVKYFHDLNGEEFFCENGEHTKRNERVHECVIQDVAESNVDACRST